MVVFDEAHALPEVATGAFGLDLSPIGLRQLASAARAPSGSAAATPTSSPRPPTRSSARSSPLDGRVDPTDGALAAALGSAAERLATATPAIDASEDATAAAQVAAARQRPGSRRCDGSRPRARTRSRGARAASCTSLRSASPRRSPTRLFQKVPVVLVSATLGGGDALRSVRDAGSVSIRPRTSARCSSPTARLRRRRRGRRVRSRARIRRSRGRVAVRLPRAGDALRRQAPARAEGSGVGRRRGARRCAGWCRPPAAARSCSARHGRPSPG